MTFVANRLKIVIADVNERYVSASATDETRRLLVWATFADDVRRLCLLSVSVH